MTSAGSPSKSVTIDAVAAQLDDLVLAELDRLAGVLDERGDVAGRGSSRPRRARPRAGELRRAPTTTSGLVGVDGDQRERALEPPAHRAHRLGEVAAVRRASRRQQVRDDLGVGLRGHLDARASSSARSSAKFSMIPLWITATGRRRRRAGGRCGRSGRRGWPSGCGRCPVVDAGSGSRAEQRLAGWRACPAFLRTASAPSATTATPAESYPRYSSRRRPADARRRGPAAARRIRRFRTWAPGYGGCRSGATAKASSGRTTAASRSATAAGLRRPSGASTMTRTSGSVPLGRSSTRRRRRARPRPRSRRRRASVDPATPRPVDAADVDQHLRQLASSRRRGPPAARPVAAIRASRCSAVSRPSPVVAWSSSTTWPDCSPPST